MCTEQIDVGDAVCDRVSRARAAANARNDGERCRRTTKTPPENARVDAESRRRLSFFWKVRTGAAGDKKPSAASRAPEAIGIERVLCVVATCDHAASMAALPDVSWSGKSPEKGGALYLRTPRGLYASEIKRLGCCADALGARFVEIHASTAASLSRVVRSDVHLDSMVLCVPVGGLDELEAVTVALRADAPEALEDVVHRIYDELLTDVIRPLLVDGCWLQCDTRNGAERVHTGVVDHEMGRPARSSAGTFTKSA